MSARERELVTEEAKLAGLLKAKQPKGSADTIRAATRALTATAENVRRLRGEVFHERGQAVIANAPARAHFEREQRAKREQRDRQESARKAANRLLSFADPELVGARLDTSRLSEQEGDDLLGLVEDRIAGTLTERKRKRFERLVGKLAGEPGLYERKRAEREAIEAEGRDAERARRDALPLRRFEGKGGAYLPAAIHASLTDPRPGTLTVTDAGVLAAVLLGFENGEPPFLGATIEAGTIVLDGAHGFQLRPGMGDDCTGASRVRDSIAYLAELRWLTLSVEAGATRIGLGERATRLLETATA